VAARTPPAGFYVTPHAPPVAPLAPLAPPLAPPVAPPVAPFAPPVAPVTAPFVGPVVPQHSVLARAQHLTGQARVQARVQAGAAGSAVRGMASRVDTARVAEVAGQVGRTTVMHTGRAARRTVTAVAEFGTGIGAFWQGLWTFVTSPVLWLYAVLPAAAVYLSTFAGRAGADAATDGVTGWAVGLAADWPGVLRWALENTVRWGLTGLAYMLIGFLVVPLTLIIGAPFLVLTVRRMERRLGEPAGHPDRPGWVRASGFVMSQTILVTLVIAFGGVVLVPILFIPGINVLVAVTVAVLVNGFVIGLLAAGPPLHHRGVGERLDHVRYVWRRRWPTIGFGTMSVLVLSIPFAPLRWFTIPAVFIGAVLLHRKFPHEPARPGPPVL
jgi:CysZ protein